MNRNRNFRHLYFLALVFVALGTYWYELVAGHERMRTATIQRTETVAQQLANGMAEQMASVIRNINFVSNFLRQDYVSSRASFASSVQTAFEAFPPQALIQVAVIDRDGYLAFSSLGNNKVFLGDREHFRIHAEHPDADQQFISKPLFGRVSNAWSIQFSRPIRRDGHFVGVLVLSISPEYLSRTLEQLNLGANDSAGLILDDGSYLARNRDIAGYIGKKVKSSRPYLAANAPEEGVFHDESTHEPIRRIFAWHRMHESEHVLVYAGIAEEDVLNPIESQIAASVRTNLAGSVFMLLLAGVVLRQWVKLQNQHEQLGQNEKLYRSFFEKHSSIKMLIDQRDGRIRRANDAAARFYGYSRETLQNMHIGDLNQLPGETIKAKIDEASTKRSNCFVFRHRLADGQIRDVEVYSCPIEIDAEPMLYSIIHDITERKELEIKLKLSEERYRSIFSAIPNGMMLVDGAGEILLWNDAAPSILNVDAAGLKARTVRLFYRNGLPVPPHEYPSVRANTEQATHGLYYLELDEGSRRWIAVHTRQLPQDTPGIDGAVVSFTDVSRLIALEESLLISQSVFESATEGIVVTDADSRIIKVNPAFSKITGYDEHEVLGKTPAVLASGHHDDDFYAQMYQALDAAGSWEGDIANRHKNGRLFIEKLKISAVRTPGGALLRYVALLSDITNQKEQEAAVWHRAHHDALTGLPNRNLFLDRLGQSINHAQRRGTPVGLLFIDLDRFKPVNDTYGHQMGDTLLCLVAGRINECIREEDTVARIGGDEFVVLLPQIHQIDDCEKVAGKILEALRRPFEIDATVVSISASIGIATCLKGNCTAETLLERADRAMYEAKQEKNSYVHG